MKKSFDALSYLQQEKVKRRILKSIYKQRPAKPIKSLMDEPRCHYYDEYGEGWCEYGLYEDDPELTDEELDKEIWDSIAIPYQWREYDCTGQAFTWHIHWKRLGNGLVSVINYIHLDV